MTDAAHADFEGLLRRALSPVDPPADFRVRLESTLQDLTDIAVEELDAWELAAMRDPRNWGKVVRPAAAVAVGGAAGAALVVLRVRGGRRRRRASASHPLAYASQTVRAAAAEARRLVDR